MTEPYARDDATPGSRAPSARSAESSQGAIRALAWSGLLILSVYVVVAFTGDPTIEPRRTFLNAWFLLAPLAATILLFRVAARPGARRRPAWALFGCTTAMWTIGQAIWAYEDIALGAVSRPSASDVAFATTIPLVIAGFVLMWRGNPVRWFGVRSLFEGLVVGSSLFIVQWVFVLEVVATRTVSVFSYAYAIAGVVIVTASLLILPRVLSMGAGRRWMLGVGVALIAAGNSASLVAHSAGAYHIGHPIDLLWLSGFLVVAGFAAVEDAARRRPMRAARDVASPSWVAYAAVGLAILASSVDTLRDGAMDAVIFAAGLLIVVPLMLLQALGQIDARLLNNLVMRQADDLQRANDQLVGDGRRLARTQALAGLVEWEWDPDAQALRATLGNWTNLHVNGPLSATDVRLEDWQQLVAQVGAVTAGERPAIDIHVQIRRTDGSRGWLRIWCDLQERSQRLRGLAQEITDLKELEQSRLESLARANELRRLREMDEMRATFINVAAHELNTPLTPLRLQLEILRRTMLASSSKEAGHSFDILDRSVERLTHLVRDLLETGRLQAGRMKFAFEPMNLSTIAAEAVDGFHGAAYDAGVTLFFEAQGPEAWVHGDAPRLHEVLSNLLSNAIKFTPPGGRVDVRLASENGNAVLTVHDSGIGIDAEALKHLFHPFSQAGRPVRRTDSGSGLGLYIARGIAEAHGGTLDARSEGPDNGSTFVLRLPMAGAEGLRPTHAARQEHPVGA